VFCCDLEILNEIICGFALFKNATLEQLLGFCIVVDTITTLCIVVDTITTLCIVVDTITTL